jgi:hypothetical protein
MGRGNLTFTGGVKIYLEGKNALLPLDNQSDKMMSYFIGSPESTIRINDYRRIPIEAAKRALSGIDINEFADLFNQPAKVNIRTSPNTTEIDLFDNPEGNGKIILWMGVVENGEMDVYDIEWEILKPVGPSEIAFAAIVRP